MLGFSVKEKEGSDFKIPLHVLIRRRRSNEAVHQEYQIQSELGKGQFVSLMEYESARVLLVFVGLTVLFVCLGPCVPCPSVSITIVSAYASDSKAIIDTLVFPAWEFLFSTSSTIVILFSYVFCNGIFLWLRQESFCLYRKVY